MRVFKKQFYAASLRKQRFRKLGKSELQEVILTTHFGSMFWKGYAMKITSFFKYNGKTIAFFKRLEKRMASSLSCFCAFF